MTVDADYEDGFYGYEATTNDPGLILLIGTIAVCVVFNALIPCFVAFGSQRDKARQAQMKVDPWAIKPDDEEDEKKLNFRTAAPSIRSVSEFSQSIQFGPGRSLYNRRSVRAPSMVSMGLRSTVSGASVGTSIVNQSVVTGLGGRRSRNQRRFRRALEKREMQYEAGVEADSFFRFNQATLPSERPQPLDDDQSCLSKMDTDEVSVKSFTMDADNEDFIPKQFLYAEEDEVEITCCGVDAWWKPNWAITYFDRIVALSEWDFEMRKIMRLTIPFVAQAVFTGLLDVMTVAIIGKLIGTTEATSYVIVDMLIGLTDEFVGGFISALTTLCSQAAGANQNKLCGQYVQMAMILYILFSLPFMYVWWAYTEDAIYWLGFDETAATMGSEFAKICIFSTLVEGINETLHSLLEVIELENYSTVVGISEDVLGFVLVLLAALLFEPSLFELGLIHLGLGVVFLLLNIAFICVKGWFKPYLSGMLGTFALLNFKAVWLMCKTALALSAGYLLTDGEWEIMTLLASFLGPAEVAAWTLIGTVWGCIEALTEAIGDAAEIRCSFLLGCGKPTHARVSSYKSMLIATISAFLVTSILFTMGEDIATWLTNDPVLQKMIVDVLPLFGLGNITMTVGTASWTLLGAQGRYRLATTVAFLGSWLVTIPLSVLASVALHLTLEGQTAAVVVGYMASGTINAYFLFRSDWEQISQAVINNHQMEMAAPPEKEDPSKDTSDAASVSSQGSAAVSAYAVGRVQHALQTP
ncbi:Protein DETOXIFICATION [Seminavis robusta]|uniref:Protein DETOXIFICATION n=1 Tax=Seminavis robusta TaxID=568900 RepID=A0A9N8EL94_9STRA|nr:Protein DETOXIFICATION [Seminavis robusta]|eukprot:Sro1298_g260640.1 Protein DETOXIFICATION (753) ;mRNA; r:25915-28173